MAKRVLSKRQLEGQRWEGIDLMENTARSQPADGGHRSITDIDRNLTVALLLVDARENRTQAQDVGKGTLLFGDCRIRLVRTLLDFFLRHRFYLAHHLS